MNENFNNNIICPQCGNANSSNTNFCIKCGNNLKSNINEISKISSIKIDYATSNSNQQSIINKNIEQPTSNSNQQSIYNNLSANYQVNSTSVGKFSILQYLQYIIGVLLKPFDSFKNKSNSLNSFKNVGILSAIIVGLMTIMGLFQTMLNAVRVTSIWTGEVKWVWDNLKEIEYFKVIGQSILIYVGILLVISGIYFLANLVIKKEAKFVKLLGATVTAFIPFALSSSILFPIFSLISNPLGICIIIIGFIYTLIIMLELMNDLIIIENKNNRIYFHLICLSILIIGGGFIAYKLILGSLASGLGGLSSLF